MGHYPPPTVGLHEDPPSGRPPCLRKIAAGGLTGLWDTKLISLAAGKHAEKAEKAEKAVYWWHRCRLLQVVALVVWSSQPGTTPLAACPTYQVRSSTSAKTVHGDPSCTAPGVCMWPKTVDQTGLQGSRGRGSAPRPRGPPAARAARTRCAAHTPVWVPRRTHPPAPRARTGPPAPARTRPRRPGVPLARPRAPAPARAPQSPVALRSITPTVTSDDLRTTVWYERSSRQILTMI